MTRPVVSGFTEQVYAQLPAMYADNDSALDYPLLRFLSLLCDQAGEVAVLHERLERDGGGSELADPSAADPSWLQWLAQLVGADITGLTGQAARDAIEASASGFYSGTKAAIAAAARSALTGTRAVSVYDHSITTRGDGGQWDVLIVTRSSETPDPSAVLAAVAAKNAKPAGVRLHHMTYTTTWAAVEAAYPTWGDIDGKTWVELEETGL